jgi:lysyl-tRNA synthetase, class II
VARPQEEQAAKAAANAAAKQAAPASALEDDDDELDPNLYFERRVKAVAAAKDAGRNPYPHKFQVCLGRRIGN